MATDCPAFVEKPIAYLAMVEKLKDLHPTMASAMNMNSDKRFGAFVKLLHKAVPSLPQPMNFAGTYLRSNRKQPIPEGQICIVEGHSLRNRYHDWVIHATIKGDYWLCVAVPMDYLETMEQEVEDDEEAFVEWSKRLGKPFTETIDSILVRMGAYETCDMYYFHMVMGTAIQFPSKYWKHLIIETGQSDSPMAALLIHPLTEDTSLAKDS